MRPARGSTARSNIITVRPATIPIIRVTGSHRKLAYLRLGITYPNCTPNRYQKRLRSHQTLGVMLIPGSESVETICTMCFEVWAPYLRYKQLIGALS